MLLKPNCICIKMLVPVMISTTNANDELKEALIFVLEIIHQHFNPFRTLISYKYLELVDHLLLKINVAGKKTCHINGDQQQ